MPIYEYKCEECGKQFEELVFAGREPEKCPQCGSTKVQRQMSCFSSSNPTGFAGAASTGCGGGGGFG